MIVFPNCKINLGLSVINKRKDGFHNLETIFYPLPITDVLEITRSVEQVAKNPVKFSTSGLPINGNSLDNLCLKAYQLLKQDFPVLPSIQMHLHKAIPMGAGLGGGSADGAFVLTLLNRMFSLGLSSDELIVYAAKLGSDCPFFIINKPCFASGRGEIMEPVALNLSGYRCILVNCGLAINTGWAFSQIKPGKNGTAARADKNIKNIIMLPPGSWKDTLTNDFEEPVFEKYPVLQSIKDQLYAYGATYASMSGSGSTVFGIFEKGVIPVLDFPAEYQVTEIEI